ncbi:MAG: hypothetical protein CM15mP102_12010 [Flavobacteriales bacterium]|nr:MAG: hypothetical protein CM15mP102_12010 [Flavobacteriales bacterium]
MLISQRHSICFKEISSETKKDIYGNLSAWQRVQLSRHPNRPYALDYIKIYVVIHSGIAW